MNCNRNGCGRQATHHVYFYAYPVGDTVACLRHARWWTVGVNGTPIGLATQGT